jgi:hypothetical protein
MLFPAYLLFIPSYRVRGYYRGNIGAHPFNTGVLLCSREYFSSVTNSLPSKHSRPQRCEGKLRGGISVLPIWQGASVGQYKMEHYGSVAMLAARTHDYTPRRFQCWFPPNRVSTIGNHRGAALAKPYFQENIIVESCLLSFQPLHEVITYCLPTVQVADQIEPSSPRVHMSIRVCEELYRGD